MKYLTILIGILWGLVLDISAQDSVFLKKENTESKVVSMDTVHTIQQLIRQGEAQRNLKSFDKASTYFRMALNLAQKIQSKQLIAEIYQKMALLSEQTMKDLDSALYYYKQYKSYNDSLFLEEKTRQAAEIQHLREIENKNKEIENLKITERNQTEAIRINRIFFNTLLAMTGFVLLLAFVLYRNNRQKQLTNTILTQQNQAIIKQKEEIIAHQIEIEKQNKLLSLQNYEISLQNNNMELYHKDITDSIEYAQRIQSAMLPLEDKISKFLPEHFILFKPKDIVSGDFYWFSEIINEQNKEEVIISAIDCTGHGVPGAFMSLIGNELLNDIVIRRKVTNPAHILTELHKRVRLALNQEQTGNKDGMDMALCKIDKANGKLFFAGAYNPAILIQNKELKILKGDNNPIGGWHSQGEERKFSTQEINIQKGDVIYLYTDGYQDQFGGVQGRKLMKSQFRDLLFSVHEKELSEQRKSLEEFIMKWMEGYKQVDDILVIGLRIDS